MEKRRRGRRRRIRQEGKGGVNVREADGCVNVGNGVDASMMEEGDK